MNRKRFLVLVLTILALPIAAGAAEPTRIVTPDEAAAVKDNNAFAVELYKQLQGQPGNLFFSPESISTALAMAYAGARGDTATEMANTFHFILPQEKLHPAMASCCTTATPCMTAIS